MAYLPTSDSPLEGEMEGPSFTPTAYAPVIVSVPKAAMSAMDVAKQKTMQWLSDARLTKLIPVFEENEMILEEITDLSEAEFEEFVNELAVGIVLKKRLRKAVATLKTTLPKTVSEITLKEDASASAKKTSTAFEKTDSASLRTLTSKPKHKRKRRIAKPESTLKMTGHRSKPGAMAAASSAKSTAVSASLSTGFVFESTIKTEWVVPAYFGVPADLKTIQGNTWMLWSYYNVLKPAMHSGTHSVHFKVQNRTGGIGVGVTDAFDKNLTYGCYFKDQRDVYVNGESVAMMSSAGRVLGGWGKGDCITLTVDLDSDNVSIKTPYGAETVKWKPQSTSVRFGVSVGKGSVLSIV